MAENTEKETKESKKSETTEETAPQTYAVIAEGGKQYRVAPGDKILVEKLAGEEGESVELTNVLLKSEKGNVEVGAPLVAGAKVKAKILSNTKGPKIDVYKRKRRQGFHKKKGHRQPQTELLVEAI